MNLRNTRIDRESKQQRDGQLTNYELWKIYKINDLNHDNMSGDAQIIAQFDIAHPEMRGQFSTWPGTSSDDASAFLGIAGRI